MKTTVSIKLDSDVKQQAAELARQLGLSLSAIINADLKQLISSRELHLSVVPKMTPHLEAIIVEAEDDLKSGRTQTFGSVDELFTKLTKT